MQHFGGQIFGFYDMRRRHHGEPVADVFKLAHIAGEVESAEQLQRLVCDSLGLNAQLLGALLQKVARQHEHVFTALAQRGQAQADHVQAVKQVFAESTVFDALLQVLVGGGDDAHIGLDRVMTAHAVKMAVAEHAQQTRLQIKGHVADFI